MKSKIQERYKERDNVRWINKGREFCSLDRSVPNTLILGVSRILLSFNIYIVLHDLTLQYIKMEVFFAHCPIMCKKQWSFLGSVPVHSPP